MNIGVYSPDSAILNDPTTIMAELSKMVNSPNINLEFFNTMTYRQTPYDNLLVLKYYTPGMAPQQIMYSISSECVDYLSRYKRRCKVLLIVTSNTDGETDAYIKLCNSVYTYATGVMHINNIFDVSFIYLFRRHTGGSVAWNKSVINLYVSSITAIDKAQKGMNISSDIKKVENIRNVVQPPSSLIAINRLYNYLYNYKDALISNEEYRNKVINDMRPVGDEIDDDRCIHVRYFYDIYKWAGLYVSELVHKYTFSPDTHVTINHDELRLFFDDLLLSSNREGRWIVELIKCPFILHTIQYLTNNVLMFYGIVRDTSNRVFLNTLDPNHMNRVKTITRIDIDLLTRIANMDMYLYLYVYPSAITDISKRVRGINLYRTISHRLHTLINDDLNDRLNSNIRGLLSKHRALLKIERNYQKNGWQNIRIL